MAQIRSNKLYILIFTAPALLLFFVFVIYPIINTFYLGTLNTDGISHSTFIGIKNFARAFADKQFINSNIMSLWLALLCVLCDSVLALAAALALTMFNAKFQKFCRSAYLIPMVLSVTVISQMWLAIYNSEWGLLNHMLGALGLTNLEHAWLTKRDTAMICVAIVGMWQFFGLYVLLTFAGIKQIPDSYYEAARIDGANFLKVTRHVTLPLLNDIIKLCVIMGLVGGLYTFPQVYVMTKGGPGNMTMTVMMYIYKNVFYNQYYGYGSAIAAIVIVETFILLYAINRLMAREKIEF